MGNGAMIEDGAAFAAAGAALPGASRSRMRALWLGDSRPLLAVAGAAAPRTSGPVTLVPSRFGSATRIERGTTNVVPNPSFELDSAGWSVSSGVGEAIARTTSYAAPGAGGAALEVTVPALAGAIGTRTTGIPLAAATTYTWSLSVRLPAGQTIRIAAHDSGFGQIASLDVAATGDWQRVALTFESAGAEDHYCYVMRTGDDALTFHADAAQLEAAPYATSYCDGSLGAGYAWTGTAHASPSTRAACRVELPAPGWRASGGGLAAWVRPAWAGAAPTEHSVLHREAAGGGLRLLHTSAGHWRFEATRGGQSVAAEAPATHATGDDVLLVANWSPSRVALSVDGGAPAVDGGIVLPHAFEAARFAEAGRRQDVPAAYLDGALGPLLVADRPLTAAEVTALARLPHAARWRELV